MPDAICTAHGTHKGKAWACSRKARAKTLCQGHYRAKLRHPGKELEPLKEGGAGVKLPGITVSHRVEAFLRGKGPNLYEAAKEALEGMAWEAFEAERRSRAAAPAEGT